MKKPIIVELNDAEREDLKKKVSDTNWDSFSKKALINNIDFTVELQRQLKEAKISISMLRKTFGSDSEALKKLLQTH